MSNDLDLTGAQPAATTPAAKPVTKRTPMDGRSVAALWIGIVLAVVGLASLGVAGYTYWVNRDPADIFLAKNAREDGVKATASGLQYKVIKDANGPKPTDSDVALVNYTGTLTNGTVFDKSTRPTPLPVTGMIPGFSEALKLMPKGSKYRFWLKPSLAYGDVAQGPIPAHSVLVFDVELVDFKSQAEIMAIQQQLQAAAAAQRQKGGAKDAAGALPAGQ